MIDDESGQQVMPPSRGKIKVSARKRVKTTLKFKKPSVTNVEIEGNEVIFNNGIVAECH